MGRRSTRATRKRQNQIIIFTDVHSAVEYITKELRAMGFIIHRYDAVHSKSIYLKFDYGIAQTLRISDHRGKSHLNYKYNLNTTMSGKHKATFNGYSRYTYGLDCVQTLVEDIVGSRETTIKRIGQGAYNRKIRSAKQNSELPNKANRGFWRKAQKV